MPPTTTPAASIVVGADPLTPHDVVAIAEGRRVQLDRAWAATLTSRRRLVDAALQADARVYGLTTGVGPMRTVAVTDHDGFDDLLVAAHAVGIGDPLPDIVVRAAIAARANGLVRGGAGVRPQLIDAMLELLNQSDLPTMPANSSLGQSDLAPLAAVGAHLVARGFHFAPREALALVNANGLSTGWACLAFARADTALRSFDRSAAVTMEALVYNRNEVDEAVYRARPHPGIAETITLLRSLLAGGALLDGRAAPRVFQDALCLRVVPQTHAATRAAIGGLGAILQIELASAADNPLLTDDGRFLSSVGNHDPTVVALALDHARLGLGHAVTIACERIQKLLWDEHSGLPTGLRPDPSRPDDALAILSQVSAALAAEARLLAQPVSLELSTSSVAASIEDRMTMAPAGARRLEAQAAIAIRLAACELACAAQALDLNGRLTEAGTGVRSLHAFVRSLVAFTPPGQALSDLSPLARALETSALPI